MKVSDLTLEGLLLFSTGFIGGVMLYGLEGEG